MPSVILTRSVDDNRAVAPLFEARGCTVRSAPMIELRPLPKDMCGLRSVRRLAGGERVLITSAYAAELWLDLRETDFHEHPPAGYLVVGETSAALLRESDPDVPVEAVAASAEDLLRHECVAGGASEGRILYPCSTGRRDTLVDGLTRLGLDVVELPLYSPARPDDARATLLAALADAPPPLGIAFFSPSAVVNFFSLGVQLPAHVVVGAIGATTAGALAARGIADPVVPEHPDAGALAGAFARALA